MADFHFLKMGLPKIEYTPPPINLIMLSRWYAPIYKPTPQENLRMFAQSMIHAQIAREIEEDADKIWQRLLRSDLLRTASVENLEALRVWWFRDGYSEHVHAKASAIRNAWKLKKPGRRVRLGRTRKRRL